MQSKKCIFILIILFFFLQTAAGFAYKNLAPTSGPQSDSELLEGFDREAYRRLEIRNKRHILIVVVSKPYI